MHSRAKNATAMLLTLQYWRISLYMWYISRCNPFTNNETSCLSSFYICHSI